MASYALSEIHSYHCHVFAGAGDRAAINLNGANDKTFAIAIFQEDASTLPQQYQGSDGIFRVYYHRSAFADVIDLLRNEKPMYFFYWYAGGTNTCITSATEPVGEEESA